MNLSYLNYKSPFYAVLRLTVESSSLSLAIPQKPSKQAVSGDFFCPHDKKFTTSVCTVKWAFVSVFVTFFVMNFVMKNLS